MRHVVSLVGDDFVGTRVRLRRRDHGRLRHQPARRADAADDRRGLLGRVDPKILGGNVVRVLRAVLPSDDAMQPRERRAQSASPAGSARRRLRSRSRLPGMRQPRSSAVVDLSPWTWYLVAGSCDDGCGDPATPTPRAGLPTSRRSRRRGAFGARPSGPRREHDAPRFVPLRLRARGSRGGRPCTVFLDFRLLELEPPLAGVDLAAPIRAARALFGAPPPGESDLVCATPTGGSGSPRGRLESGGAARALLASARRRSGARGDVLHHAARPIASPRAISRARRVDRVLFEPVR